MENFFNIGKKITALSFITMILILNLWVINSFVGSIMAAWSQDLFYVAIGFAIIGGLLMIPKIIKPKVNIEESDENSSVDN